MLRSILCLFRVDLDSELVQFWLHVGFSLGPFWFHFGSILDPFGVHFGSIWGPWRGPVEEKLPSRTEDRWDILAHPHLKRFWAQKDAARRPKIHSKSMQKLIVFLLASWMPFCIENEAEMVPSGTAKGV